MQDIQFLESSADILIIIQIRFIRGTEPPNDEGVQKIWNNSLTQQMFVASLIIIRTGWDVNVGGHEMHLRMNDVMPYYTWRGNCHPQKCWSTKSWCWLSWIQVLFSSTTTTTRDHFRVQDMWIRAQRSPCTGQDTWQCLAKDPLVAGVCLLLLSSSLFAFFVAMQWNGGRNGGKEKKHSTNWLDTNTW